MVKKEKDFKGEYIKKCIDWDTYKMKTNLDLIWILVGIIMYSILAYMLLKGFFITSDFKTMVLFIFGVISLFLVIFYLKALRDYVR